MSGDRRQQVQERAHILALALSWAGPRDTQPGQDFLRDICALMRESDREILAAFGVGPEILKMIPSGSGETPPRTYTVAELWERFHASLRASEITQHESKGIREFLMAIAEPPEGERP